MFLVAGLVLAVGCALSSARGGLCHTRLPDTTYTNQTYTNAQQCRSTHPLIYLFNHLITHSFTQLYTNPHSLNQTHKHTRRHANTYVHSFPEPTHPSSHSSLNLTNSQDHAPETAIIRTSNAAAWPSTT